MPMVEKQKPMPKANAQALPPQCSFCMPLPSKIPHEELLGVHFSPGAGFLGGLCPFDEVHFGGVARRCPRGSQHAVVLVNAQTQQV